jgi:hypothetical protein
MKSFILKSLLFFAIFFGLEKSLILLRNSAPGRELDKRLENILKGEINADVIILGSSRGARDIMASNIADSLNTTAYNLSYPGSDISFHEYLLEKLVKFNNKKPKLVILAADDPVELILNNTIYFRLDRLYPLVKYEDVRKTLIEKGEKDKILSNLFIIHQLGMANFDIRKKHFSPLDTLHADGSMPISFRSKKFTAAYNSKYKAYDATIEDSNKIKSFTNFLKICKDNNIKLVLALAPNFGNPSLGFKQRMEWYVKSPQNHVMLYDTSNAIYKNENYFYDAGHLTKAGADIFTAEVIDYVKKNQLLHQ